MTQVPDAQTKAQDRPGWLRWAVLFAMSMVVFGSYYVYDALSPLKRAMEAELGFTSGDFGWIVSFYSLPNMLGMTMLGGLLMDRKGVKFAGFIFVLLTTIGALLSALAVTPAYRSSGLNAFLGSLHHGWSGELMMMVLGRFLFGIGAEVVIVAQNKVVARWFKGKELSFAFGLNLMVCRLGTIIALNVSSGVLHVTTEYTASIDPSTGLMVMNAHYVGLPMAMWIAGLVALASLAAFFLYMFLDREDYKAGSDERIDFKQFMELITNRTFLYIAILCVTFYSAVFPFTSFAPDILQNKYGLSTQLAGTLTSMVTMATVVFTPLAGWLIDRYGKRATIMIYGSLILIIVHLTLAFTSIPPYIPMGLLGIAFSLVPAAMWPSVPYLVKESQLGTAYGAMGLIQNIGLWGIPILIGKITDWFNPGVTPQKVREGLATWNYVPALIMLSLIGAVALVVAILLLVENRGAPPERNLELPSSALNEDGGAGQEA